MLSRIMTRREQFVLVFIAGALLVGAAVVTTTMRPKSETGTVTTDSDSATVKPKTEAASSESSGGASPAVEETAPAVAVVSVSGAVRRPDVYQLPAGSRVNDLIEAAGGASADADLSDINLAAKLIDGSTLTIPSKPGETEGTRRRLQPRSKGAAQFNPPEYSISRWRADSGSLSSKGGTGQTPTGIGAGGLININTASQEQLESLPGVGPVRAGAIIRYRTDSRFATKADLMNVSGIGPKTFENIASLVVVR